MNKVNLSYVLTTKNKIDYLREVLSRLLNSVLDDEEIVVVDSNSNDGTFEYLESLYRNGEIHQFISETDYGQAHGINKGILLAKGELIKIIHDDDAYYYSGINKCKEFMLRNEDVDLLLSNICNLELNKKTQLDKSHISFLDNEESYDRWIESSKPFGFSDLSIIFRRASIPLMGLFPANYKLLDIAFSYHVTSLKINMGFCNLVLGIRIGNPGSLYRQLVKTGEHVSEDSIIKYIYDSDYRDTYENELLNRNKPEIRIKQSISGIRYKSRSIINRLRESKIVADTKPYRDTFDALPHNTISLAFEKSNDYMDNFHRNRIPYIKYKNNKYVL